jgi:hypothetical protein
MADAVDGALSAAVSGQQSPVDALNDVNGVLDQALQAGGYQK